MQKVSDLYRELFLKWQEGSGSVFMETKLVIGDGPDAAELREDSIISLKTEWATFSEDTPSVGAAMSATIDAKILFPASRVPRMAKLMPYVRLSDGNRASEWLPKGVFYTDTRAKEANESMNVLSLRGYDSMLMGEADYPSSNLDWPAKDIDVVREIARFMGVEIDDRTVDLMSMGYMLNYPAEYSCREVLGFVAGMYCGSFCMSDLGQLRLVQLGAYPKKIRYLGADNKILTIGGVAILV